CVRCALNIPLSSILMTSYATVGSSSSETTFSPLPTPTVTASPFKLTIEDKYTRKSNPNGKFKITENAAQVACGEILSLNYTNKHYDKIIGIIKNDSEAWRALGTINGSKVDFKMPGSGTIPPGIYKMVVYDECNAGAYKTNYAEYDTLTLRVVASGAPTDTIAPSILNAYKNQAGTMYKITVEDTGSGLAQLNSDKEVKYISPIGVSATPIANTTKNIETSAGNSITVYDLASNAKPVSESEIIVEDKTAPVYTITYHKGDYTIHVSDNESGVWKITDSTGTKVLKDWSR
ncbi:MAG: hypothetical protein J6Y29_01990, partial [Clostridiales bacterium]|nr:hypothetical protein [Clostridiales bacterium]